jgi:negative regulator of flagellin synthesis FlgM
MTIDRLGPVDPVAKLNKTHKAEKPESAGKADSISLSSEAIKSEILFAIAEEVKATPDIRMDKVEAARARINDPAYMDKALDQVAGRIVDLFGV